MPYEVNPEKDCANCSFGKCVAYIRTQSKKMKDRNTLYRMSQKKSMACTFDRGIPISLEESASGPKFSELTEQCVENSKKAGSYISKYEPEHFGEVEAEFQLTSAQIGKVKGDVFEILIISTLWNLCIEENKKREPGNKLGVLSLGDNYRIETIFEESSSSTFINFQENLNKNGTSLSYSTPDLIIFKYSDSSIDDYFSSRIENLSLENQEKMSRAQREIIGKLKPCDIFLAAGIKTSIRSDRMYQLLFEANSWKTIWRSAFNTEPSEYHAIAGQVYGANPEKLNSVEFTSLIDDGKNPQKAIDDYRTVDNPIEIKKWFESVISRI